MKGCYVRWWDSRSERINHICMYESDSSVATICKDRISFSQIYMTAEDGNLILFQGPSLSVVNWHHKWNHNFRKLNKEPRHTWNKHDFTLNGQGYVPHILILPSVSRSAMATSCQYFIYELRLLFSSLKDNTFDCHLQLLCSIFVGTVCSKGKFTCINEFDIHMTMLCLDV
jgi:hypothetical protein